MTPDPAPAPADRDAPSGSSWATRLPTLLPWLLLLAALVTLVMLRSVENLGEIDQYPEAADNILRGELLFDPFHSFGYPVAIAATTWILGTSTFHSALLLAMGAALLLVWAGTVLADSLLPGTGRTARWLFGANALVWTTGATAAADLPAAALLVAGAALAFGTPPLRSAWRVASIGVLLGLAMSMHPILIAPTLAVAAVAAWRCQRRWLWFVLAAAFVVGYLPHLVPCLLTDRPLLGNGWHNVYLKVVCNWDGDQLQQAYDNGTLPDLWSFLAAEKGTILSLGLRDIFAAITQVLPAMMVGSAVPVPGVFWWLPALALTTMLCIRGKARLGLLLIAFFALHLGVVCIAHQPISRSLLPSLAILLVGWSVGLEALRRRGRIGNLLFWAVLAGTIAIGLLQVRRFWASEPTHEVAVARTLPARLARPIAVLSTYRMLDHYVDYPCWGMTRRNAASFDSPERAWATLRENMQRHGASILMVGRTTNADAFAAIADGPPPADFEIVHRDDDVFVAAFVRPVSNWIDAFEAPPGEVRRGHACEFVVRLSELADVTQIVSVGVVSRRPDGTQPVLDLARQPGGEYRRVLQPDTAGTWLLQPVILRRDGTVLYGADRELVVIE